MKFYLFFTATFLSAVAFAQRDIKATTLPGAVKATTTKPVKATSVDDSKKAAVIYSPVLKTLKTMDIVSPMNEVSGSSARQAISGYAAANQLVTITITPTIKSYPPSFYTGSGGTESGETKTFEPVIQKVTSDAKGNWITAPVFMGVDKNQEDAVYKIEAVAGNQKTMSRIKNTTRATGSPVLITSNTDGQQLPPGTILIPKGKATPNSSVNISVYVYAEVSTKKKTGLFQQFINFTTPVLNIVKTGEHIASAFNNKSDVKVKQYSLLSQTVKTDANGYWSAQAVLTWPPDLMRNAIMPFAATISARPAANPSPNSYFNTHTVRVELQNK